MRLIGAELRTSSRWRALSERAAPGSGRGPRQSRIAWGGWRERAAAGQADLVERDAEAFGSQGQLRALQLRAQADHDPVLVAHRHRRSTWPHGDAGTHGHVGAREVRDVVEPVFIIHLKV